MLVDWMLLCGMEEICYMATIILLSTVISRWRFGLRDIEPCG